MRPQFTFTCENCGKTFERRKRKAGRNRFCSHRCAGQSLFGRPVEVRFWEKVNKSGPNGCWLWTASMNSNGYGKFGFTPYDIRGAHRVAWELANGPLPAGQFVCHTCDNPPCVNPAHLFLGTPRDNVTDMIAKGRKRQSPSPGSNNGRAKLSEADVLRIREMSRSGMGNAEIAKIEGMSREYVWSIVTRRVWKHL